MRLRFNLVFLFFIYAFSALAQEGLSPLHYNPVVADKWKEVSATYNYAKIDGVVVDTLSLPFLDDFSENTVYPDTAMWIDRAAYVNNTYAISPPSLGVATLDGIDSIGLPYDPSADPSASLLADHLTSKPIDLGAPLSAADSIYFSFYYQAQGLGNSPEPSDSLILEFRSPTKDWTEVWYKNGYIPSGTDTAFHLVMIPVTDTAYLKKGFQFRFLNYATISGNDDQWNIDYVYLNKSRNMNDTIFSDVSFVYNPPSFLNNYQSEPWNQFITSDLKSSMHMFIRNNDTIVKNSTYRYQITDTSGAVLGTYNGNAYNTDPFVTSGYSTYQAHANPPLNFTAPTMTDSAEFTITHILNATPDFDRGNDTDRFVQKFYDYYAYDDGSAEAAYYLSSPFAQLAYKFTMNQPDTLRAVQMFFNHVVDNSALYGFRIMIWKDNNGVPANTPYYKDSVVYPIYESGYNHFHTYKITNPALVLSGTFYIGWMQLTAGHLNVGFDRNTDAHKNLFYNVNGNWTMSNYKGSLMLRPVFGKAIDFSAGVQPVYQEQSEYSIYPNPAKNEFYFSGNTRSRSPVILSIYDDYGRLIRKVQTLDAAVHVGDLADGLYIVRIEDAQHHIATKKLIIAR